MTSATLPRAPRLRTAGVLATAALLALSACGGSSSSSSKSSVTIGLLFPYSGPAASYGQLFDKAVDAGLRVAKDKYGTEFTLTTKQEDSQNSAQGATTAMNALASVDRVTVALTSGTAPGLAAAPIAARTKIPLINGSAADPKLADVSGQIINLAPLADQQVKPLMPYVVRTKGLTHIAIVHTTDALGTVLEQQVTAATTAAGGQVVKDLAVSPSTTDFSAQATLLQSSGADAIYLASSVGVVQYTPIYSQFRAAGLKQTMLGFNALNVPQVKSLAGVDGSLLVDEVVDLQNSNWATTGFVKAWNDIQPGQQPTPYVVNYANAVLLVAQAVHELVAAHKSVTGTAIAAQLHADKDMPIIGGTVTIAQNGTTDLKLAIYQLTGGGNASVVQDAGSAGG